MPSVNELLHIVETSMLEHYSSSLWVLVVLQGIKLAKKSQNYRKLTPNLLYQDIEYSGGLKTFTIGYE